MLIITCQGPRLTFNHSETRLQAGVASKFFKLEVFAISFSIMGLLPSIASTLAYSIPAGPAGMVWVSPGDHESSEMH